MITNSTIMESTNSIVTASANVNHAENVQQCESKKRKVEHPELITLVSLGSIEKVKQKLLEDWDPNVKNEDMITPALKAAERNDLEMLQLLSGEGAKLNIADLFGNTPLIYAQTHNNDKMIQLILKAINNNSVSNN
jgi:ankyrin repeat protein